MKWRKLLPLVGILIFIYLILKIGINDIISSFIGLNVYYLLLAFFISIITIILPTIKWLMILKEQNINLDFLTIFKLDLIGTFYGMLTPGRVGNLIRVSYLRDKIKKHIGFCTTSVILDKLLDLLAMFVFASMGALLLLSKISGLILPTVLLLFSLIFCTIFFSNKNRSKFVLGVVYKFFIPKKHKRIAKESFHEFYENFPKLRYLFIPFIIALLSYLSYYTLTFVVALAFSVNVPYIYFITLIALAGIISILPITVAGIGTREASLVVLLRLFNIADDKIIAMSITSFIIAAVLPVILGWYYAIRWDYD